LFLDGESSSWVFGGFDSSDETVEGESFVEGDETDVTDDDEVGGDGFCGRCDEVSVKEEEGRGRKGGQREEEGGEEEEEEGETDLRAHRGSACPFACRRPGTKTRRGSAASSSKNLDALAVSLSTIRARILGSFLLPEARR